jgi:hypothetical protein
MVYRRAHCANAIAFHQNFAGLEQGSGFHLEQPRGVEDDGRGGWLLCRGRSRHKSQTRAKENEEEALRKSRHG